VEGGRAFLGVVVVVCLAWAAGVPISAQEAVNYASIAGRITDSSGAVVVGANVEARQTDTNTTETASTDRDGRFRFPYLKVGPYEVKVHATGFADATRRLTLGVGAAFDLPIALSVGTVTAEVNVNAEAPLLETARSQIAVTVPEAEVKALPLNGRNFLDLALLIPGVSPTNVGGGTQLFPETSAVQGVGISVGSQRNLSNNFMVDGLSANDDAAALSGISYGVDAIEEFQVVTSGGQAELGRAIGGHINVATRSGTNALQGDTYGFFRDDKFNGLNALSGTKLPMHQNQYGTSLGGPLVRDRTFFFGNFEQKRLDQTGLVTIGVSNTSVDPQTVVDTINARLKAVGYGGPLVTTGVFPDPINTTNLLGRVDHSQSSRDHLSIRYSLYDANSENSRGAGGLNAPSASAGLDNLDQTIAVSDVLTLSPRLVLEVRGQFADSDLKAPPADPIGPSVSISGVASFGTLSGSPTARLNRMYQVVNNVSMQAGAHAIRVGVDVLYNDDHITYPRSYRGSYTFSNLTNFLNGVYNNSTGFTQTFGVKDVVQTNPNVGVYAQDEWKIGSNLTVNAGLRYDLQFLDTINTDTNNVSPRFGFAWSPLNSQRMLVRGTAGRFYDRIPLRAVANALLSAGNTIDLSKLQQISVSLSPGQTGAPVFPDILTDIVPTTTLVNFTTMDRNIQNAYSNQASIEIEEQLGASSTVSVGYDHLRGRQLIMSINQNVPTCPVSGNNNGCRPNPAFANDSQYSSVGSSDYDGLHLSFVQRPIKWGTYRVSYTYSKAMNNVGENFFSGPIDAFDINKDWGRSDDDQRHRLTINGAISSPSGPAQTLADKLTHDFQLSWMLQYYSALPFNITTGANTVQGTAARPVVNGAFIPRNSGIGGNFSTTSVRLSRTFVLHGRTRLEGLIEAFNVFNQRNDLARVTVFGTGAYPTSPALNYGAVTVVGDPRSLQFGLRLRY
jgi:outer membrane receptor protein involved in Fe transport